MKERSKEEVLSELRDVSDSWLASKHGKEKGFSLGYFDERYLQQCPIALVRRGEQVIAFANLWATADEAELSVDLMRYLDQNKIGTRLLFAGNITRQPYFKGQSYRISGELCNTDTVMNSTFWVGVYPGLTEPMLDFIADKLETFMGVNI